MSTFASTPGALQVLASSLIARLPLTMLGIGLLVHAEHLTGSFAVAGLVSGAYAIATGIGGPFLGRLVDRRGQTIVLAPSVLATAALLGAAAVLPQGVSAVPLLALATGLGLASPPLAACVRALIPDIVRDPGATRVAYAVDATAVELTWILGPPLALGLGALWSTGAALAAAGAMLLLGAGAFVAQPATRAWRPAAGAERPRGGSLGSPGMRTLVIVLTAVGVVFGAVEVGVAAAAEMLASTAAAAPLLGAWGLGSLVGGAVATRRGGGARTAAGLALLLAFLAVAHLALVVATGSLVALAAALFVAGAAIAPTYASVYAMVGRVAPAGTVTEAFAWLTTAMAVGAAAGAAAGGVLAERATPATAFVLAGAAGLVALIVAVLRGHTVGAGAVYPARAIDACTAPSTLVTQSISSS